MKLLIRCIIFAIIPASLFYCLSVLVLKLSGFGIMEILRDPAQQSGASSFLGFISNIGIWLWVASAAICFFAAFNPTHSKERPHKELLILIGLLSMILAVDDFFMIHDRYVKQEICYLVYAVSGGTLLIRHYKTIFKIGGLVFMVAGGLMASSILTDLIQSFIPLPYALVQLIEEGFKFVGAATWLFFNIRAANWTDSLSSS